MPYNNSSGDGFYQPPRLPLNPLENYEEFINRTRPDFTPVLIDGINNLVNMLPDFYATQTLLGAEEVIWLRRKTNGPKCPNMGFGDDTTEEQCNVSKCPLCYNTTFFGGYDNPIKLRMSFNPQKQETKIEQAGLTVEEMPTAWTIDTDPIMKEMDLIVTYGNERYLIDTQESETKQGKRIYQRLVMTKPDKYDVTYRVPVPSIYGEMQTDFSATMQIRPLGASFPATIYIYNELWYPLTGQNDQAPLM